MGVKNYIFWSEIGSVFGEPGGSPPPRILRIQPPPLGGGKTILAGWHNFSFLIKSWYFAAKPRLRGSKRRKEPLGIIKTCARVISSHEFLHRASLKKRPCRACLWEHTLVILLHLVSLRLTFKRVLIAGSVHRCTGRYGGRCVVAREQVISSTTSSSSCNNYAPDNFHKPYPSMSTNWSWDCSLRRDVFVPLSCRALNLAVKSPWKSRNDSGARV